MGRKATAGNRSKGGRKKKATTNALRLAWDYGNPRVQARRALFDAMSIKGGKAVDQVFDGIGQLWALDFLDGHGFDGDSLRDIGRLWTELWWSCYGSTKARGMQFARSDRAKANDNVTGRDRLFLRLDDAVPRDSFERQALFDLLIEPEHSDDVAFWVERLVSRELLERGRVPDLIQFPTPNDHELLNGAIRGLCMLIDGSLPARWSQPESGALNARTQLRA